MEKTRAELSQLALEKIGNVFKSMHKNIHRDNQHCNPLHRPFADVDLSRREIFFIFIVARSKNGISVKDLARFSQVTSGAVTQFIDSLISKNIVQREVDEQDRRIIRIKLTDFAKSKFENFKHGYFSTISPIFSNLTDQELHTFINLLDKISISH
jgi:DNA-binding MarR family transcriptional regulator